MMRDSMIATISSSVAENSVCWCDGRRMRSTRAPKLRECSKGPGAAGDGMKVRFYTVEGRGLVRSYWNCWNSAAVMFELRCSEFELFCSESTGQPQDQETRLAREQAGLENPPLSCCEESKAYITVRCSCSGKIMHVGRV